MYEPINFRNLPNTTTPISADNLNHVQTQFSEAVTYTDNKVSEIESAVGSANEAAAEAQAAAIRAKEAADSVDMDAINQRLDGVDASIELVADSVVSAFNGAQPFSTDMDISAWGARSPHRIKVPTYVEGADGQATHPSVIKVPGGWNGYEYWMAHTPYKDGNDTYENPSIIVSHDGESWVNPPGISNPIDTQPGTPVYNSDPCLVLTSDDILHIFWRTRNDSVPAQGETVYHMESVNGIDWSAKTIALQANSNTRTLISPAVIREADRWVMYYVDRIPTVNRIMRTTAPNFNGPWGTAQPVAITALAPDRAPWHLSVIRAYGAYWMLLNDTNSADFNNSGDTYLGSSQDGLNFTLGELPAIVRHAPKTDTWKRARLYQGSLVPSLVDGVFGFDVWLGVVKRTPTPVEYFIARTHLRIDGMDSGWLECPVRSGFSMQGGRPPEVRRMGSSVRYRWGVAATGMTPSGANIVADVPAGLAPRGPSSPYFMGASNVAERSGIIYVGTDGGIVVRPPATLGTYYIGTSEWELRENS